MAITWKKIAFDSDVVKHSLATAESDFLVASGAGLFVKKTLAETKTILGIGSGGSGMSKDIAQASHGFAVGDVLKYATGVYAKAKADSAANAEVVGIVSAVADTNNFTLLAGGYISGLSGLTSESVHFLSGATAGALTATEPTTEGHVSKPLLIAVSTSAGYFFNMRGSEIANPATAYYQSFTSANLSAGVLTVTHNLGHKLCQVQVFDNNDKQIIPDEITLSGTTALTVDLSSYGTISGTWHVCVLDIGAPTAYSVEAVLPMGWISGLQLSHGTDTEHDITVVAGKARNDADTVDMALASALTKQADATWAGGTDAGGMASGESLPTSGTIHVWLIKNPTSGDVDVMFNDNASSGLSPTLPSGYTVKRRIGSYRTDDSANILNGDWWGSGNVRTFMYDLPILDVADLSAPTSAETITLSVPSGIIVKALTNLSDVKGGVGTANPYMSSLTSTDIAPALNPNASQVAPSSYGGGGVVAVFTSASSQCRVRCVNANYLYVSTIGWEDSL